MARRRLEFLLPIGLLTTLVCACSAPDDPIVDDAAPRAAVESLSVSGNQFVINGTPTFLLGVSYYDALNWRTADLDQLEQAGFNLIRIWADWKLSDDNLFDSNGNLDREAELVQLVQEAGARGIVVDVTIMATDPSFGTSLQNRRNAVASTVAALRDEPNVLYDLTNEYTVNCCAVPRSEIADLVNTARAEDPGSILTASTVGAYLDSSSQLTATTEANILADLDIGLDVLAPHTKRDQDWARDTDLRVSRILGFLGSQGTAAPVYMQEEHRRDFNAIQPGTNDFLESAAGALEAGAAGWVFHTDAAFDLRNASFFQSLDGVESDVVEQLADHLFGPGGGDDGGADCSAATSATCIGGDMAACQCLCDGGNQRACDRLDSAPPDDCGSATRAACIGGDMDACQCLCDDGNQRACQRL